MWTRSSPRCAGLGSMLRRYLFLFAVAAAVVLVPVSVFLSFEPLCARRCLLGCFRRAQESGGSIRLTRLAMWATAVVTTTTPCEEHDELLAQALARCRFDRGRSCHLGRLEMRVLDCLTRRMCSGSVVARRACLGYLERSARFLEGVSRDDVGSLVSVMDQQCVILCALVYAGDASGLRSARTVAERSRLFGVMAAVDYVGRFGDDTDQRLLGTTAGRIGTLASDGMYAVGMQRVESARVLLMERCKRAEVGEPDRGTSVRAMAPWQPRPLKCARSCP